VSVQDVLSVADASIRRIAPPAGAKAVRAGREALRSRREPAAGARAAHEGRAPRTRLESI
jgi:hypothetical protein